MKILVELKISVRRLQSLRKKQLKNFLTDNFFFLVGTQAYNAKLILLGKFVTKRTIRKQNEKNFYRNEYKLYKWKKKKKNKKHTIIFQYEGYGEQDFLILKNT